ncbi:alpha/beta hydrolase family protein [Streptomyces sp. NPDC046977]|uniref:alpha/beta hydrolase n=1 Tax=Streptomyces sp. NPDC046977 TaxID=3154703 RepID=UPI0033E17094
MALAGVTALTSPTAAPVAAAPRHAAPAAAAADDGARITQTKKLGPQMWDLKVNSPAMGKTLPVRVILPKSWADQPTRRFPVLYLLQGVSDNYTAWTRETDVEQLAARANFLVVMPDGGRAGFYSDWWDHDRPDRPRWETFHIHELIQIIERRYRASGSRAVIGLSEGGLGALNYASRYPGLFRYAGSFSGITDTSDTASRAAILASCLREGLDPVRLWGDPKEHPELWEEHNPLQMIENLRGTTVHLSAGNGKRGPLDKTNDPFAQMLETPLPVQTFVYSQALRRAGVDVTTHIYPRGTHSWPYWKRELHIVWPKVSAVLAR